MWRECAAALAVSLIGCSQPQPEPPEIVILLSVDTLNRSALQAFNSRAAKLPNLDEFASQAVRYRNAYSTAPWTLPAHGSLLTGLYPDRHLAVIGRLSPKVWTLAEGLRDAGFLTVAFTDGGYVDSKFGLSRGFLRYDDKVTSPGQLNVDLPRDGKPNNPAGAELFDRAIAFLA